MNRKQYMEMAAEAARRGRVDIRDLLSPAKASYIVSVKHSLLYAGSMLGESYETMAGWSNLSHSAVRLALSDADSNPQRAPLAAYLYEWACERGYDKSCRTRLQNRNLREEPSEDYPDECPRCGYHFSSIHALSAHMRRNGM